MTKKCVECGREIPKGTGANYGILRQGVGDYGVQKYIAHYGGGKFVRCISLWRLAYYKLRDLKRLLFRQYTKIELWYCDECERADEIEP